MMKTAKKSYITPAMELVRLQASQTLLAGSPTGSPTPTGTGISYDGPGGSFGSDDSVAAREWLWDDEDDF